jgi:hypothetical protein
MIPHESNDTSHIDTINERSSPNRRRRRRQIRGTAVERRCRVHLRSRPRPRRANTHATRSAITGRPLCAACRRVRVQISRSGATRQRIDKFTPQQERLSSADMAQRSGATRQRIDKFAPQRERLSSADVAQRCIRSRAALDARSMRPGMRGHAAGGTDPTTGDS